MEELKIGGNTMYTKIGKKLVEFGNGLIDKHTPILAINPSAKLINPFTLLVTFTVTGSGSGKYQIVIQGDYKEKYKVQQYMEEDPDGTMARSNETILTKDEMFHLIESHKKEWFKKE